MEKERRTKRNCTPSSQKLRNEIITKMTELGLWKEELQKEIPTYWDNFSNFIFFNSKFFRDEAWTEAGSQIWEYISQIFSGKSIALHSKIQNDEFRSPTAKVVHGKSPWVEYIDNRISYTWNLECTMFCTGNVSERHRVASFDCKDKVVVDMFAGIGYFTLPYLVHAGAKEVIACEWNPMSVKALELNLTKNKVSERCVVNEGDVREVCPRGVADHVNLGLIPSCEEYWPTAAKILKPIGGVLHVHGNVSSFSKTKSSVGCEQCSGLLRGLSLDLLNLSKEKSFGVTMHDDCMRMVPDSGKHVNWKRVEWFVWATHVAHSFCEHLCNITKAKWTVAPLVLHKVKAFAPHINHLVLDISCKNTSDGNE